MTLETSDELLNTAIKEQIGLSIEKLKKLYDEDINTPDCTENRALLYIPLFVIEGLLLASMLGVTSDELLAITDYLIDELNLTKQKTEE